jgi:hypothetical protein
MYLIKESLRDCSIIGTEEVNKVLSIREYHGLLLALDGEAKLFGGL